MTDRDARHVGQKVAHASVVQDVQGYGEHGDDGDRKQPGCEAWLAGLTRATPAARMVVMQGWGVLGAEKHGCTACPLRTFKVVPPGMSGGTRRPGAWAQPARKC